MIGKFEMSDNNYIYSLLAENVKMNNDKIRQLNLQAIHLAETDEMMRLMREYRKIYQAAMPGIEVSLNRLADELNQSIYGLRSPTDSLVKSLKALTTEYRNAMNLCNANALSDEMRTALETLQLKSIIQLNTLHKTEMINDVIHCFANAKIEHLPKVINTSLEKSVIGAADIAFLKNGTIIPVIEGILKYPRGLKTSLKELNRTTAIDIADNGSIAYDTRKNKFCSANGESSSKTLNVLCSGIAVLGDDMFSETELIDFVSTLSQTPMLGGMQETGRKIYDMVCELFNNGTNTIGFDKELFYHARSRDRSNMPYPYDEMLKAPHGIPAAGRFNQIGRANYYFADTQYGAEVEVKKHLTDEQIIQTVKLKPVKRISLLDLSGTLLRGKSFLRMIRYSVPANNNNKMPKEYLLPCFVADCCQKIGFDGIKYYGSKEYNNYVSWSDEYFEYAGMCSKILE